MPLTRFEQRAVEDIAGAIDQGGALLVLEVLLKAVSALPPGRDLLLHAMEDKTRELAELAAVGCLDASAPAALALMRQVVEEACGPARKAAA